MHGTVRLIWLVSAIAKQETRDHWRHVTWCDPTVAACTNTLAMPRLHTAAAQDNRTAMTIQHATVKWSKLQSRLMIPYHLKCSYTMT